MTTLKTQIKSNQIRAKQSRQEALERYYKNPNCCLNCNKVIAVKPNGKVQDARRQKFCSRSCAAQFNNKKYPKRKSTSSPIGTCQACSRTIHFKARKQGSYFVRKYCTECARNKRIETSFEVTYIATRTKADLFKKRANWQSARSSIAQHARYTYLQNNKPKCCIVCGYDKYIEICHIQNVSSFPDDALVSEINDPNNLIALCPNHHWEFDNGLLILS